MFILHIFSSQDVYSFINIFCFWNTVIWYEYLFPTVQGIGTNKTTSVKWQHTTIVLTILINIWGILLLIQRTSCNSKAYLVRMSLVSYVYRKCFISHCSLEITLITTTRPFNITLHTISISCIQLSGVYHLWNVHFSYQIIVVIQERTLSFRETKSW